MADLLYPTPEAERLGERVREALSAGRKPAVADTWRLAQIRKEHRTWS